METVLPTKQCTELKHLELADFIDSGAWRQDANSSDATAYVEAAKRLRRLNKLTPLLAQLVAQVKAAQWNGLGSIADEIEKLIR
jgi:hypothetical protein